MKTIFFVSDEERIFGEAFFDEQGNLITWNHYNDNTFRPEYMTDVFKHLDVQFIEISLDNIDVEDCRDFSDNEEALKFCNDEIQYQIKNYFSLIVKNKFFKKAKEARFKQLQKLKKELIG